MILSKRLELIINMAGYGKVMADIGTDHGFVPIEAVKRGHFESAIASDVRPGPLKRAAEHIDSAGLKDKIRTSLADGLNGINEGEADVICICGMGGLLMIKILAENIATAKAADRLILSPQSDMKAFRTFLMENDFEIKKEAMVIDEGKYYFVLEVETGQSGASEPELSYGRKECFDDASLEIREKLILRDILNYKAILEKLPEGSDRKQELEDLIAIAQEAL